MLLIASISSIIIYSCRKVRKCLLTRYYKNSWYHYQEQGSSSFSRVSHSLSYTESNLTSTRNFCDFPQRPRLHARHCECMRRTPGVLKRSWWTVDKRSLSVRTKGTWVELSEKLWTKSSPVSCKRGGSRSPSRCMNDERERRPKRGLCA